MTTPEPLTKLTVNLLPRAVQALTDARALTEDTGTDTVNRALQLYAWICECAVNPGQVVEVDLFGDGRVYRIEVKP